MEFFWVLPLRQAQGQDDSKDKSRFLPHSASLRVRKSKMQNAVDRIRLVGEGDVDGVAFDDTMAREWRLGYDGADGESLRGGRGSGWG